MNYRESCMKAWWESIGMQGRQPDGERSAITIFLLPCHAFWVFYETPCSWDSDNSAEVWATDSTPRTPASAPWSCALAVERPYCRQFYPCSFHLSVAIPLRSLVRSVTPRTCGLPLPASLHSNQGIRFLIVLLDVISNRRHRGQRHFRLKNHVFQSDVGFSRTTSIPMKKRNFNQKWRYREYLLFFFGM